MSLSSGRKYLPKMIVGSYSFASSSSLEDAVEDQAEVVALVGDVAVFRFLNLGARLVGSVFEGLGFVLVGVLKLDNGFVVTVGGGVRIEPGASVMMA